MSDIIHISTISQIHNALGLEKPKHPLVSVLPIDDRMTQYDYGGHTYLFGFYQVSLKEGLTGSMDYGRNSYDFQEGTMTFLRPNQTIKINNNPAEQGGSGWTLLFHPNLIRKSELGKVIDQYSYFSYESNEALHLSDEEKQSLTEISKNIQKEYAHFIDQHSQELIVSNIKLLLDYCRRYYDRQFNTRTNLSKDFIAEFERLLREYFEQEKQLEFGIPTVKYCGEQLSMSGHYLSDMLRKETGKSAQSHIHEVIIDKAKTKLLGSPDPVGQIAYDLGFEYPQHFSKLFKSKTGTSPGEFRNLN